MAIISGIFNSINGDRRYDAKWFARYFATFIGNGVFPNPSTGLQVTENTKMTTAVKAGDGWINGYFIVNDSNYVLQHDVADGVLKRIDRVVMRLDFFKRKIDIVVKKGAYASTPVAPTLQRDADAYELALADVMINNGATVITQANVTDLRLNKSLCGIVHGTVDQVDTTTLFNQYQSWMTQQKAKYESETAIWTAQKQQDFDQWQSQEKADFDAWFLTIQDILDGNVAANLQVQIDKLTGRVVAVEEKVTTHLADYLKHTGYAVATGNTNAYIATLDPPLSAYQEGVSLRLKINVANTGASTINVNGLGAKPIKKSNGSAVTAGNLKLGSVYTLAYDGTSFILQGEGGSGNAVASDLLSGKTASTDAGDITGAMPNNGVFNLGLGVPVPAGYYSGGTTAGGKKWASGTGTASVGILTISVLSFRPSYIQVSYGDSSLYFTATYSSFHGYPFNNYGFRIGSYSGNNQILTDVSWTPSNSGFTYSQGYASSYGSIRWIAYE